MFSRLYNRGVDNNNHNSSKSNRIRITLKDRINSRDNTKLPATESKSFISHGGRDDYLAVRSNTIGRIIQNGSQQIFYPVNPNNNFTRQPIRGCYNSNIVQNSHSNFQKSGSIESVLSSRRSKEFNSIQLLKSTSDLVSQISSNTILVEDQELRRVESKVKSMTSSIPLNLIERGSTERLKSSISQINEVEDSENERLNSNRSKYGPSLDFYSLAEDSKGKKKPESLVESKSSVNETNERDEVLVKNITFKKEKLPNLEILPLETVNNQDVKSDNGENCESRGLINNNNKEISELIPKLNKSAFYFVRFNLLLHLAAIVIQCYFRRYLCKKYLYFRKYGPIKLLNTSAIQIQACWRSFLTRFGISLCKGTTSNNGGHKCMNGYNWSILHEKNYIEIVKKRNQNAKCIQNYWRNMYIQNINIEREILANSIFSARALARETIERFILGYLVRRDVDSRYKLVPIKWGWSIQEISDIFILRRIRNRWSEPKKMWFSQEENAYRYNLFLPNGVHQIVFKVYYKKKECKEDQDYTILCDSSLETTPNDDFQFVNNISIYHNNYTVSAFKYMRDRISYINFSTDNYLNNLNSDFVQDIEQDLSYIALSPSYKNSLNIEYSETEYENSPYKEFHGIKNDAISTPSTNLDYSPGIQHFIH
ncbi:IQ calmodulin-binding motif family [Cryptosporidium sp. chipmunk genotype I]|uniref:IQ calmodulin-binding motif family n=1 Tax=Cryptosporidium sp. chipmunk genotype I TaxID=1280935 RepID=UPI00351A958F|nr:IQ calmodulin-binding motif family [Cryptosporidium sp. chipmunk genotype I]